MALAATAADAVAPVAAPGSRRGGPNGPRPHGDAPASGAGEVARRGFERVRVEVLSAPVTPLVVMPAASTGASTACVVSARVTVTVAHPDPRFRAPHHLFTAHTRRNSKKLRRTFLLVVP